MRKVCAVFLASLMVYVGGCGGGGGDGGGAPAEERPTPSVSALGIEVVTPDNPGGVPEVSISGDSASITYHVEADGTLYQAAYTSDAPATAVRVFYGPDTELPHVILDEISGGWLSIMPYGPNRVDFWIYEANGNYLDGYAVFEDGGTYYMGDVAAAPALEGSEGT